VNEQSLVQIICSVIGAIAAIIAAKIATSKEKKDIKKRSGITIFIIKNIFIIAPIFGLLGGLSIGSGILYLRTPTMVVYAPFDISENFKPSGWMGAGIQYLKLNEQWRDNCYSPPTCIQNIYEPGSSNFAGVYWQYPDKNWGDFRGLTIRGASRITFWARGERGGEIVEFIAGGINDKNKPYKDSFRVSTGQVALSEEWRRYEINLFEQNLKSVIGGFCWAVPGNPEGVTFYLDDIRYE